MLRKFCLITLVQLLFISGTGMDLCVHLPKYSKSIALSSSKFGIFDGTEPWRFFFELTLIDEKFYLNGKNNTIAYSSFDALEKFGTPIQTNLRSKLISDFDKNGRLKSETQCDRFGYLSKIKKINFNDKGLRSEISEYRPDGSLNNKTIFNYDSTGNRIIESFYTPAGSLIQKLKYTYDTKNRVIKVLQLDEKGQQIQKWVYEYNDTLSTITETTYNAVNVAISKLMQVLNKFGRLLEFHKFTGNLIEKTIFKYNINGDLKSFNIYNVQNILVAMNTYEYTYDASGNWTKRIEYISKSEEIIGQPTRIDNRDFYTGDEYIIHCQIQPNNTNYEEPTIEKRAINDTRSSAEKNFYNYQFTQFKLNSSVREVQANGDGVLAYRVRVNCDGTWIIVGEAPGFTYNGGADAKIVFTNFLRKSSFERFGESCPETGTVTVNVRKSL